MEDLSKTQLILLTLLVNFVTSIATGIMTVSLLSDSPQTITQTINRVVERTIEKVVPATEAQKATIITKEQVRVVNSDELIVAAIDRNQASLVRVRGFPEGASEVNEGEFYGLGLVVSREGHILVDVNLLQDGVAYRSLIDGTTVALEPVKIDRANRLALFKARPPAGVTLTWIPASLGAEDTLRVGQSVVAIGKTDRNVIAPGVITSLMQEKIEVASSTRSIIVGLETTNEPKPLSVGNIIVNTTGEVVAAYRYTADGSARFGTLLGAKELLASLEAPKPAKK